MKRIFILSFAIILLLNCVGCKKENEGDYCEIPEAPYHGKNIESFLEFWEQAQTNSESELYNVNSSQGSTIIIPNLQTDKVKLYQITAFPSCTSYYYVPIDITEDGINISFLDHIEVNISNSNQSYSAAIKNEYLVFENNIAYSEQRRCWLIDYNGYCISIYDHKKSMNLTAEQISEYFTFETYTASDGNDHVVS